MKGDTAVAKILKDLPLFSLIQASPHLYEKILEKMKEESPFLMKTIRKTRIENLREAANEMNIVFTEPKNSRSTGVNFSIIDITATADAGVITVEVTIPQFYGEAAKVRKATQKVLCVNGNFAESRSGIILNVVLYGDNTPILTEQHGNNGDSQKFYVARKETIKH